MWDARERSGYGGVGAADDIDLVSAGRETARALGAPFILLPRAGHLSMLLDPTGVAAAIKSAR